MFSLGGVTTASVSDEALCDCTKLQKLEHLRNSTPFLLKSIVKCSKKQEYTFNRHPFPVKTKSEPKIRHLSTTNL